MNRAKEKGPTEVVVNKDVAALNAINLAKQTPRLSSRSDRSQANASLRRPELLDTEQENVAVLLSNTGATTGVGTGPIAEEPAAQPKPSKLRENFTEVSADELASRFRPEVAPLTAVQRAADLIAAAQNEQPEDRRGFVKAIHAFLNPQGLHIVLLPSKQRSALVVAEGSERGTIQWGHVPAGESKRLATHQFMIVIPAGVGIAKEAQPYGVVPGGGLGQPFDAEAPDAEPEVKARTSFAAAVAALKLSLIPTVTDHDIVQLEAVIREAQQAGIPASVRVGRVVDIRLILEAARLELVDVDDGKKLTLTIKNGSARFSGGGTTYGLDEVVIRVRRRPVPSFTKRPSQAKVPPDASASQAIELT